MSQTKPRKMSSSIYRSIAAAWLVMRVASLQLGTAHLHTSLLDWAPDFQPDGSPLEMVGERSEATC